MALSAAVWLVIACALVMANLPFVLDRPLAFWPWARGPRMGAGAGWLWSLGYLAALAVWSRVTLWLVGGAFAGGAGAAGLFLLKLLLSAAVAAVLLALPGWYRQRVVAPQEAGEYGSSEAAVRRPRVTDPKPFIDRFLEVLVGYVLVGTLGFALELNLGNAFAQGWEFYAVTLALFLVLAYPGFVWRYMLHRRRLS